MPKERLKWHVDESGKESITNWSIVTHNELGGVVPETDGVITLKLIPITGRTHQLRVHCAAEGSGIIGDSLYGDNPIEWNIEDNNDEEVLHLHSYELSFPHPKTDIVMNFSSDQIMW
uniref:Pseudouridine synthase RsuA/RluA-like domain-containing protein n=1 Tax=Proboscia inermis TaxID=420281 RepID=A0A7S0GDF1_9STRA